MKPRRSDIVYYQKAPPLWMRLSFANGSSTVEREVGGMYYDFMAVVIGPGTLASLQCRDGASRVFTHLLCQRLHQGRRSAWNSASHMMDELDATKIRLFKVTFCMYMTSLHEGVEGWLIYSELHHYETAC